MPTSSASTYNGYVVSDGQIVGTVLLKAGRANSRTGIATLKATVTMLGQKKTTFTVKQTVDTASPTSAILSSAAGETMALVVAGSYMAGELGGMAIVGARNQSAVKETRASEYAALSGRSYNAVLSAYDASGDGAAFANGYSALTVKLLTRGKARLTAAMADGTKVAASGLQALLAEDGSVCIPVVVPMYVSKLGGFGFTLWVAPDGTVDVAGISDWDASRSRTARFTASLTCVDAALLAAPSDGTLSFSVDAEVFPSAVGGLEVLADQLPQGAQVAARSGKLSAESGNAAKLRISRTASTGLFKGSFAVFLKNGEKTKKKTVSFTGATVNGVGYGSVVVKGEGTASVSLK